MQAENRIKNKQRVFLLIQLPLNTIFLRFPEEDWLDARTNFQLFLPNPRQIFRTPIFHRTIMNPNQQPRPTVPSPLQPRGFFTGVQFRPVIAGAVVDYIATQVIVLLYLFISYIKDPFEKGGAPEEAIEKALMEMMSSQEGILTLLAIGALCTVLGGYIAGRLAKGEEVKHGALVGTVSLIIGILQTAAAGQESPVSNWYELLGYILAIPAGALGGSFAEGKAKLSIPGSKQRAP